MGKTDKIKMLGFLSSQKLATISTIGKGKPESALIAFAEDDNLCIYFQTGKHTRKAQNLLTNAHVSLVFGLSLDDMMTVQYEGIAEQLINVADLEFCRQLFITKKSPTTKEYFNHPSAIFFKVTPTWIGCSDYSGSKPKVIEIKDFRAL